MAHPLLTAPIGRSLLRLAGPTTALMVVQIFVAIAETWYVGRLGRDALAGLALVFPFMALMLNVANGGMGGGVASALARALGAGRTEDARALVLHALVVGLAIGLAFTAFALTLAPSVYGLMGGQGDALAQALALSNLWFAGAALAWVSSFFAALLRGSGDSATPARYGLLASVVYVPLSGVLALGGAGWSGFGIEGVAMASLVATALALVLQARSLWRGRLGFTPRLTGIRLQGRLFGEILKVGIMGSLASITGNLTAILVTGLIGSFGTAALAGYGIGVRLEYMVAPLAFGIGTGLTTLVGVAAGAGDWRRANSVAWIGGLISFVAIGAIGWMVGAAARGLGAPLHRRAAGDRRQRGLHHAGGAVLLHVRAGPDLVLREPRRRPHDDAAGGEPCPPGDRDGLQLAGGRTSGTGAARRLRGARRRHVHLRLPDRGAALCQAVAVTAMTSNLRNRLRPPPRRKSVPVPL